MQKNNTMSGQWKKRVLVIVETSRGYGRNLIEGITKYAVEHRNWNFFLCDHDAACQDTRWLETRQVDGLIARCNHESIRAFFHNFPGKKISLTTDDNTLPIYIRLNNEKCAQLAAEHFLSRGYENFAYFSIGHSVWSKYRYECFAYVLQQHRLQCLLCPEAERQTNRTLPTLWWSGLDDSVLGWIVSLPKPVAVLCANDHHAFYLANLCRFYGIGVPEEVAILGVDNDESLCKATLPQLSSIDPNAKLIGYNAAAILDAMMNNETLPAESVSVEPACVIIRQSTDNTAVNDPVLAHALQFIREEVARNLRVNEVAKEVGVSRGTLNTLFMQHLNSTPLKEILRVRMDWAKDLLRNTDGSITEISQTVGYQTPEYFSRAFMREVGVNPSTYRAEQNH
ncbi:MAG: DNA-binding transcriptional regulator [Planctomycetaceae bacterium]|jgi:LacI family transcriptional regulator|nr:DNA-binding transcriptional regulator [Planctomycetaceae bacterium]